MKHLAAFEASVAANATFTALTPVPDGSLSTPGSGFVIPERMAVRRALLTGLGATEGRLNVPGFRQIAYPSLYPVNKALYAVDRPPFIDWGDMGPAFRPTENLGVDVSTDATAGPNITRAFCYLGDRLPTAPTGEVFTLKYTGAPTAVTGQWVNFSPTVTTALPAGKYALIGADAYGAGLAAIRFQFPGQVWRPGVIAQQAAGEFDDGSQRMGRMGLFGVFSSTALPTVDCIGASGAIAITMYWDLIQVATIG